MKYSIIPVLLASIFLLGACTQKGKENADWLSALQLDTLAEDSLDLQYAAELLPQGSTAPDFALPTLDGDTLRLSDFAGQWTVIDFWASWCPDCRRDLPEVLRLYETYHERGIAFAAISFDTDRDAWQQATADYGIPYPQGSELRRFRDSDVAAAYGVKWIPTLYLVTPDGQVALGTVLSSRLERALQQIAE